MKLRNVVSLFLLIAVLLGACQAATPTTAPEATTAPAVEPTTAPAAGPTAAAPAEQPTAAAPAEEPTAAPAAGGGAAGEPKVGGQLVTFASSDPKNLDPAVMSQWDQQIMSANLHEGLFRLSPDGTQIENAIAQDYTVSDDGLVWTFTLRTDAKFHNGRTVEAKDFKYSFERVLDPATASPRAWMLSKVAGAAEFQAGTADEVSGIQVIDPQTLEITLTEALAPFKSMLAGVNLAVVPQEAVEEFGADFGQKAVGAGPFKLGTWNLNQDITFEAFEDYYGGRPYLDSVKWRFIGDENTRIVEFDAGNLDTAWVPPAHWDRFSTDPVLKEKLGWARTFHTEFWAINTEREPFGTNPKLREAIRTALDMDAVIDSLQGRASIAQGILPEGLLGYDETAVIGYPQNIERAKELMAEAGFADGVPGTFDVILPPWGNEIKLNELYQANLAEIGINVNLVPTEFGPYLEILDSGDFDIAWMYRVTDYADPDGFYYPLLHSDNIGAGGNAARYSNPEVDALIEEARATIDEAARVDLYHQIDAIYAADLPYVPLFHNIYVDVAQPYVMDYVPSPMDTHMYHKVWLNK